MRDFLFGNLRVKGMALIMAIALWFFAVNKQTGDISEEVPLTINAPAGLTVLDTNATVIKVSLRGPQNLIDQISDMIKDNKIKARYDFSEIDDILGDKFSKTIRLTRKNFNFPQEIKMFSMVPNEIDVVLGRLDSKYLKVQLQKQGVPASGYEIANEFFFPHKVMVTGPANILRESEIINTVPIDINEVSSDQNRTFPWNVDLEQSLMYLKDDKHVSIPIRCDKKIKVWFIITEQEDQKIFKKIKINVLHPDDYGFIVKLKDEFIDLSLKGSKPILDSLDSKDIIAYVNVGSLSPPGPYKQQVVCTIPEGLAIVGKPPEVHVDIVTQISDKKED
ncbi:MAG: CdaR family protein [Candidatus Scalindua sp.]|nr:CdaR family protein [Candidatus Scalindua sp.]